MKNPPSAAGIENLRQLAGYGSQSFAVAFLPSCSSISCNRRSMSSAIQPVQRADGNQRCRQQELDLPHRR